MTPWFPAIHRGPASQLARGRFDVRYEDIAQSGRLVLEAIPSAGAVVWRALSDEGHPIARAVRGGLVPILCRLVVESRPGPIRVVPSYEVEGGWHLAHTVDREERVDRVLFDVWAAVRGTPGRTHDPESAPDGTVPAGRYHAEHVFTRPFGALEERKVTRLDLPGLPGVPPERREWRPLERAAQLPPGAEALEPAGLESQAFVFGLDHTDSNQHVNSLVYPRLFLEAALRRLSRHVSVAELQAVHAEIGFRKPCFAGETVRFLIQPFRLGERFGAAGAYLPEGTERPSGYASMLFESGDAVTGG